MTLIGRGHGFADALALNMVFRPIPKAHDACYHHLGKKVGILSASKSDISMVYALVVHL